MSVVTMSKAQLIMSQRILPIFIAIGNLGSIFGLLVFFQRPFRQNSCILFLIGYVMSNLVYIKFTMLFVVFSSYGIDFSTRSDGFCRLRMYLSFVFSVVPCYLLMMASFDRMCISSSNVRTRSRANRRFSLVMIIFIILFWSLFHLHAIFTSEIQLVYGTRYTCNTRPGSMTVFVSYYSLIFNGLIPLIFMGGFGTQTLFNIRQATRIRVRKRERHLVSLLILQLILYICFCLPLPLDLVYQQATQFVEKTTDQILIDRFIFFIVLFCQFIQVTLSPLLTITSRSVRNELHRFISQLIKRQIPPPMPTGFSVQLAQRISCQPNINSA